MYFVSAASTSSAPDGYTWATAYKTVQAGLDAAILGDEVWVAAGTYPEKFILKNGVGLYGGFAGTETDRSQRNVTANVTVLDGGGSGTVVTVPTGATTATVLDGFTVKNGANGILCNGASPTIAQNIITGNNTGCGIQLTNSSAVITNNTITGNTSADNISNDVYTSGGGIRCLGGAPKITGNVISNNRAFRGGYPTNYDYGDGGGIYCRYDAQPVITNNIFTANTANHFGGAMYLVGVRASLTGNTFKDNTAGSEGGAIYADNVTLTVTDNTLQNNKATSSWPDRGHGGGIRCVGSVEIRNNTITGNSAKYTGGGILCAGNITIEGNTITGNSGEGAVEGAGVRLNNGSLDRTHNTITGNTGVGVLALSATTTKVSHNIVTGNGGTGVWVQSASSTVDNNLIAGNVGAGLQFSGGTATAWNNTIAANTLSDGVTAGASSQTTLVNNIVAFNLSGVAKDTASTIAMRNNCVAGNTNYDYAGMDDQTGINDNIRANPRFVNRTAGDYRLTATSGCIDKGDDSVIMAGRRDLDGKMRIIDAHVDIGAYESGSVGPRTMQDVVDAFEVHGGLQALAEADFYRLNVDRGIPSNLSVDLYDVVWLMRQLTGLDPNPAGG